MKFIRWVVIILALLSLTACDVSLTEEDINRAYRQLVAVLFEGEGLTREESPSQTRAPQVEVGGNPASTPVEPAPVVTVIADVCNLARSGKPIDVTIPDGTRLRPGQSFSKTWRLVNAGSCTWGQGYAAVWFSGEVLSPSRIQFLRSVVAPGQAVDITIEMIAPKKPGTYQSNWKLSDPNSNLFGIGPNGDAPFWVVIEVIEDLSSPTPAVTLTATLALDIYHQGEARLALGDGVNLDTGEVNTGSQDDIAFVLDDERGYILVVQGSARFARFGTDQPTDSDCRNLDLLSGSIGVEELTELDTICYRTGQALPGFFRVIESDLVDNQVTLEFVTWAIP